MRDTITADALSHILDPVRQPVHDPVHRVGTATAIAQRIDSIGILTAIGLVDVTGTMDGAVTLDHGVIRARVPPTPVVVVDTIYLDMTIAHTTDAARARDLSPDAAGSHIVAAGVVIGEAPAETLIMKVEDLYAPWPRIARITAKSMKTLYESVRRGIQNMRSCGRKV
jgi:hypothetical protein